MFVCEMVLVKTLGVAASRLKSLFLRHRRLQRFPVHGSTTLVDAREEVWSSDFRFLPILEMWKQSTVGPSTVEMAGLHTWPREKPSWRGVYQGWLAHDLQQAGLWKEAELQQQQVAIRERAETHQVEHQNI